MTKGERVYVGNIPKDREHQYAIVPPAGLEPGYFNFEVIEGVYETEADALLVLAVTMWHQQNTDSRVQQINTLRSLGIEIEGGELFAAGSGRITELEENDTLTGRIILHPGENDLNPNKLRTIFRAAGIKVDD